MSTALVARDVSPLDRQLERCAAGLALVPIPLAQQGHPAHVHIGVQRGEALLVAHAWVTLENAPIGEDPRAIAPYTAMVTHGG